MPTSSYSDGGCICKLHTLTERLLKAYAETNYEAITSQQQVGVDTYTGW